MPDRFVLARSDTREALSIVSGDYRVVQPREVLEFYRDLVGGFGYTLETAGALHGGRKVWVDRVAAVTIRKCIFQFAPEFVTIYSLIEGQLDR